MSDSSGCLLPADIWYRICIYSSLKTLHMLRATSREMRDIVDSRSVWAPYMVNLTTVRPSVYSVKDFEEMSATQLREAAVRMVLVDRAYASDPTLPHKPTVLFYGEKVDKIWTVALFPGGERLLIGKQDSRGVSCVDIYDIANRKVVRRLRRKEGRDRISGLPRGIRICPTSVRSGFFMVEMTESNIADYILIVDVYKYTEQSIHHVFTERCGRPSGRTSRGAHAAQYSFCHHEGITRFTYVWQPNRDDGTIYEFSWRTMDASGRSRKETRKFKFDLPPSNSLRSVDICMKLVSPRYLLLDFEDVVNASLRVRYYMFDLFQMHGQPVETIFPLRPIWTSPPNIYFTSDPPTSPRAVLRNPAGFEPSVRVFIQAHHGIILMDIPALGDIHKVQLYPLRFPSHATAEGVKLCASLAEHQGYHHALMKLNEYEWRYSHWRTRHFPDWTHPVMERVWSIAAPWPQHESDGGSTPSRLRFGNTALPATHEKDGQVRYSVDDLSGAFIKHRRWCRDRKGKVVLYTLGGDA